MAQIQIKSKYLVLTLCGVILAIFLLGVVFGTAGKRKALKNAHNSLHDTCVYYQVQIDKRNMFVAEKEQTILSQREAIRQGEITREELRKLNLRQANEINRLKLKVDTLLEDVGHSGTIITIHDTISVSDKNCIILPFDFAKQDEWLDLRGKFDADGELDVRLNVTFSADLWAGVTKKTKTHTALLTTDCPYIKTVSFNSIKLDLPKKRKYGIGLNVGYGLMLHNGEIVNGFYVGGGVSFTPIQF